MKNNLTAISIVVSALIIAGAIVFVSFEKNNKQAPSPDLLADNKVSENLDKLRPIKSDEHIKGDFNADIRIVEYSDFECPFCKRFHYTMQKIMDEYGKGGKVAWVYRHFPLEVLHPKNASKVAEASECVASLGGNEAFWKFTDKFFDLTPSNDRTDLNTVLPAAAKTAGIDYNKLKSCIDSGKFKTAVEADFKNATETGGRGTPWSILITKDGTKIPINGALPYEAVKQLIDAALQ
jgi:protein-disulfide isomerase